MSSIVSSARSRRPYWPLIGLLMIFLIPLVAASILLNYSDLHALPKKNYGVLIEPPQTLQLYDSTTQNQWQLIYVQPTECSTPCQATKQTLANLHTALGAEKDRVLIVHANQQKLNIAVSPDSILVVNPQNMYIMNYPPGSALGGVLKDLRRLLKYSHA